MGIFVHKEPSRFVRIRPGSHEVSPQGQPSGLGQSGYSGTSLFLLETFTTLAATETFWELNMVKVIHWSPHPTRLGTDTLPGNWQVLTAPYP